MAPSLRIAVIGAGVSGITAANVLQKTGHQVVVYDKCSSLGGQWTQAYPDVTLQRSYLEYTIPSFPWPSATPLHPNAAQVLAYLSEAVRVLGIDVRLGHEVVRMEENPLGTGWRVTVLHHSEELAKEAGDGTGGQEVHEQEVEYDFVVVASGFYNAELKLVPDFPNREAFKGRVVTEKSVSDYDSEFKGKTVLVLGFGKSALDMAAFAAEHGAKAVHHVFRSARWLVPRYILGVHWTHAFFSRFGSAMIPSWAHPSPLERWLHSALRPVVSGFWKLVGSTVWWQFCTQAQKARSGPGTQASLNLLKPSNPVEFELRSSIAFAPESYFSYVARGVIIPHVGTIKRYTEKGVLLSPSPDKLLSGAPGTPISADAVVLAAGSRAPTFPYLPHKYRVMLEEQADGGSGQLYRHLLHPRIPNLAFAGMCNSYQLAASVEVGAVWLAAVLDGHMVLPAADKMEESMARVRRWKLHNILRDPATTFSIGARAQQYLDILMLDLGLSPYCKWLGWNLLGEVFGRYGGKDYSSVLKHYLELQGKEEKAGSKLLLHPVASLDT